MIKKGTVVAILPEWQDPGDNERIWVAVTDEEKGRLDIGTLTPSPNLTFGRFHIHTVNADWLRPKFPLFPFPDDLG
ncbi:MAG TPA: hypothetical protein VKA08_18060 [Balneolales bacterium]|nr:hypothetical protein [Balneolales bacterium]